MKRVLLLLAFIIASIPSSASAYVVSVCDGIFYSRMNGSPPYGVFADRYDGYTTTQEDLDVGAVVNSVSSNGNVTLTRNGSARIFIRFQHYTSIPLLCGGTETRACERQIESCGAGTFTTHIDIVADGYSPSNLVIQFINPNNTGFFRTNLRPGRRAPLSCSMRPDTLWGCPETTPTSSIARPS